MTTAGDDRLHAPPEDGDMEEMPRVTVTRRNLFFGIAFTIAVLALIYFVLPQLGDTDLEGTWAKLKQGDPFWLALALLFAVLSFGAYLMLFRGVYVRAGLSLNFRECYEITMASLAATRIFAAGGAGGIALTAWALRRAGLERRKVADETIAFLVLMYFVYTAATFLGGLGLYLGIFSGPAPFALTVIPAIFAAIAMIIFALVALTPTDLQQRLLSWADERGGLAKFAQRASNLPAAMSAGVRTALAHVRDRDPALAASIAYWAFNVAVLWASFKAFGASPPVAVIVVGFFVGMLANLLPLPGGVGGVDGGMIGALHGFGIPLDECVLAVLTYRVFVFWLPTIPGAIAYFQLRRTVHRWKAEGRDVSRDTVVATVQA